MGVVLIWNKFSEKVSNSKSYIVQCATYKNKWYIYAVHTVYTVHCIVYIIQCIIYTVQCTVYNILRTSYNVHCTHSLIYDTVYYCKLHTILILYIVRQTLGYNIRRYNTCIMYIGNTIFIIDYTAYHVVRCTRCVIKYSEEELSLSVNIVPRTFYVVQCRTMPAVHFRILSYIIVYCRTLYCITYNVHGSWSSIRNKPWNKVVQLAL